jgi:hypothetical protein
VADDERAELQRLLTEIAARAKAAGEEIDRLMGGVKEA